MQNADQDEDIWADVRFVFYNDRDEPVDISMWNTVHFALSDVVLVEGNSIRGDVVKFNAQFRNLKSRSGRLLTRVGLVYEHGRWRDSILPK
jgi:hypothetical protein